MEQPIQIKRELKTQEVKDYGSRNPKDGRNRPMSLKEASDNDILIATIIATVTFAAAFQVPGGYESDGPHQGLPLFRNKPLFNVFIICDCLAFGLSSGSIFLPFLVSVFSDGFTLAGHYLLRAAILSTSYSILAMVGVSISAVYLVSENSLGIKIAAYVCGFGFVFGYLNAFIRAWMKAKLVLYLSSF